ncbi:hypothetical protein MLD38_010992 [Melastoma candidum]|uniref:Uncharacterized protein n=1 Tax=Melastoma candidum TaxID=119954 RepID=A0ACB9R1N5_9MYRT|nr:hypothetical protein MLD38_010992 [Melastoma candidum]
MEEGTATMKEVTVTMGQEVTDRGAIMALKVVMAMDLGDMTTVMAPGNMEDMAMGQAVMVMEITAMVEAKIMAPEVMVDVADTDMVRVVAMGVTRITHSHG